MHLGVFLKESGLSQATFGEMIGKSQAAIERYVNGKRRPNDPEILQRIFDATGGKVTANDFYLNAPPPQKNGSAKPKSGH